jgi:5-deoxy-glucuronate isomerase
VIPLRFQATGRDGYEPIVQPDSGLEYIREFGLLCLPAGAAYAGATADEEALLHVVEGTCDVTAGGVTLGALGTRAVPFEGRPSAVYLPPQTPYRVTARGSRVEVAIAVAAARPGAGGAAVAIRPETLSPRLVGKGNWARTVTMLVPPDFAAQGLILGETLNPPGNWSGVPAHKHDTLRPQVESVHEELYYFRVDPPGGWGIERVYSPEGRDELLLVQDRVVTLKPRGYHTVAAAPGCTLCYLFVLSGPVRALTPFVDPLQASLAV